MNSTHLNFAARVHGAGWGRQQPWREGQWGQSRPRPGANVRVSLTQVHPRGLRKTLRLAQWAQAAREGPRRCVRASVTVTLAGRPPQRGAAPRRSAPPPHGAGPGRAARFRHGQRLVGPSFPAGLSRQSSAWMFAGHGRRPSGRVLAAAPSRRFGLSASGPCHPVPVSGHRAWVTVRRFRSSRIVAFFQKTGVD